MMGRHIDIAEPKQAEEALRQRVRLLELFIEHSPAAIALFDRDMKYLVASRRWLTDHQLEDQDLVGRSYHDISPDWSARWKDVQRRCLAGAIERSDEDLFQRADGTSDWVQWECRPWYRTEDEVGGLILFSEVVTDRKQSRDLLAHANERLRSLSRRLLKIQETERRYLATELHDEIGQALTAVKINLQALRGSSLPAAVVSRLEDSASVVDRALKQVRSLSLELRPPMLDDLGLAAALRWLTDHQAIRAGLRQAFHSDLPDTRLDPAVETACFRVAQEAINNVVKHAGAQTMTVNLDRLDGTLHLHVNDDGVGFDVATAAGRARAGQSLGLLGMEERAKLAGGGITWISSPGRGTQVHAWLSLDREGGEEE